MVVRTSLGLAQQADQVSAHASGRYAFADYSY